MACAMYLVNDIILVDFNSFLFISHKGYEEYEVHEGCFNSFVFLVYSVSLFKALQLGFFLFISHKEYEVHEVDINSFVPFVNFASLCETLQVNFLQIIW